ncbi:MAG: hypothetical protein JWQ68_1900 [Cryobacterium sp.]|jgi:hypothetical protein|nr:hypothetical protein [Cryobacterium sp.]
MEWWNSFITWLTAVDTLPVIFGAVVLIVAFALAGALAAWIARGAIRAVLQQRDRELKAAAIGALVDAATEASVWNSLTPQEQIMADRAVGLADIQLRLLPVKGAAIAADWAGHQLAEFKRTSATFGYQLEPSVLEFRDRLLEWQKRPGRARKVFQGDLDRWRLQGNNPAAGLAADQDAWVAKQHHEQFAFSSSETASNPPTRAFSPAVASPSTETQRLLDDVDALEVRPAGAPTMPKAPTPGNAPATSTAPVATA